MEKEKRKNEERAERNALYVGLGLNVFSSIVGILFYLWTRSISIFMDGLISLILSLSTMVSLIVVGKRKKGKDENYPFGRYPIETLFVILRTILMMGILAFTIYQAAMTIKSWNEGKNPDLNLDLAALVIYLFLMSGATLLIYLFYRKAYLKGGKTSPILKVEMVSAVFDALVTIVAISSLILFKYIPFLNPVSEIGDSITAIILSLFYFIEPLKILLKQLKILLGKRTRQEEEKALKETLSSSFPGIVFYDAYIQDFGSSKTLYLSLHPKEEDEREFYSSISKVRLFLASEYPGSPIFISTYPKMLHEH